MTIQAGFVGASSLDKVDRLFACNVGKYVDLPQLVVVGDQSSGKSSVLEGLTKLPFPRSSGLCTRFATQIIFRRYPYANISASIIPSPTNTPERQKELQAWKPKNLNSLDSKSFETVMKEATEAMGVGTGAERAFSRDVLRLEVMGPDQEHFSVIDVPGIFKRTTPGLTTEGDIRLVDEIVDGYMDNQRSVMLVVIPCTVDIATQDILQRATKKDEDGIRTFGVLTKPDLMDKGSESAAIDLLEGRQHKLRLGWHLLRNSGQIERQQEKDPERRKALEEAFFNSESPWKKLPKEQVGIDALRRALQKILEAHIEREFPKVKQEIVGKLKAAQKELQELGPPRRTDLEKREYLLQIATKFQDLVSLAIQSNYGRSTLFDDHENLRLANVAVNRGEVFSCKMNAYGHAYHFDPEDDSGDKEDSNNSNDSNGEEYSSDGVNSLADEEENDDEMIEDNLKYDEKKVNSETNALLETLKRIKVRGDISEIVDLLAENKDAAVPIAGDIMDWLKGIYHSSRGFELGTFATSMLSVSMRKQAQKWRSLSLVYIVDMVIIVHTFIVTVLEELCPSPRVREGLINLLSEELMRRYKKAIEHTEFLVGIELDGTPATYNHYFNDMLQKHQQQRLRERLTKCAIQVESGELGQVVRLEDIVKSNPLSNVEHTIIEIHDILRAYYKVALKRFVDCVRMQVADTQLVIGRETPLTLFSAQFVVKMTSEAMEEVAGEERSDKILREKLERDIKQLEEARKIISFDGSVNAHS